MTQILRCPPILIALTVCRLTLSPAVLLADDQTPSSSASPQATLELLRSEAEQANVKRQEASQSLEELDARLMELQRLLTSIQDELVRVQKDQEQMQEVLRQREAELEKTRVAQTEAEVARQAAEQALQQAQAQAETTRKQSIGATENARAAAAVLHEISDTFEKTQTKLRSLEQQSKQLLAEVESGHLARESSRAEVARLSQDWISRQQRLEGALRESGLWISFASDVAPILASRCLACHDARTAKGKLNLNSFAALMRGGESGPIVESGKADDSLLCLLVEDGSMPQDADPLSEQQITTIRNWVSLGGGLDAGVAPEAPLIRIMPKPTHPPAPESYPSPMPVTAVAFSPDGGQLATSGYHEVLLWNTSDGTLLKRIGNVAERIHDLEYHPDGRRLAVAAGSPGQMGELKLCDVAEGTVLADLITLEDAILAVAFSPDGSRLAVGAADRSLRVFETETGRELHAIEHHADWVMSVAFSPDGTRLASASRDKTAKLFDSATGEALLTFNGHGEIVYDVSFLTDGKRVATSGGDRQIRVWDTEKGEEQRSLKGFDGDVLQFVVLPDDRVVACGEDHTLRGFSTSDGKQTHTYDGHQDWIYAVDFHAASKRVASGSYDGEVRLWNCEEGTLQLRLIAAPGLAIKSVSAP